MSTMRNYISEKYKILHNGTPLKRGYHNGSVLIYNLGNTVTYIVDGVSYQEEREEGADCLHPTSFPTPSKAGYVFAGWNTTLNTYDALTSLTMGQDPITLYAIFLKDAVVLFEDYYDYGGTVGGRSHHVWHRDITPNNGWGAATACIDYTESDFNIINCTDYRYCTAYVRAQPNGTGEGSGTQQTIRVNIGFNINTGDHRSGQEIAAFYYHSSLGSYYYGDAMNRYVPITFDISGLTGNQPLQVNNGGAYQNGCDVWARRIVLHNRMDDLLDAIDNNPNYLMRGSEFRVPVLSLGDWSFVNNKLTIVKEGVPPQDFPALQLSVDVTNMNSIKLVIEEFYTKSMENGTGYLAMRLLNTTAEAVVAYYTGGGCDPHATCTDELSMDVSEITGVQTLVVFMSAGSSGAESDYRKYTKAVVPRISYS